METNRRKHRAERIWKWGGNAMNYAFRPWPENWPDLSEHFEFLDPELDRATPAPPRVRVRVGIAMRGFQRWPPLRMLSKTVWQC